MFCELYRLTGSLNCQYKERNVIYNEFCIRTSCKTLYDLCRDAGGAPCHSIVALCCNYVCNCPQFCSLFALQSGRFDLVDIISVQQLEWRQKLETGHAWPHGSFVCSRAGRANSLRCMWSLGQKMTLGWLHSIGQIIGTLILECHWLLPVTSASAFREFLWSFCFVLFLNKDCFVV